MAFMKVSQKFPCGYEMSVTLKTLFATPYFSDAGICPLHGKKCVLQETGEWNMELYI